MGDLEHLDLRQPASEQHGVDLLLDVAHEQEAMGLDGAEQDDDTLLIAVPVSGGRLGTRPWSGQRTLKQIESRAIGVAGLRFAPPARRGSATTKRSAR